MQRKIQRRDRTARLLKLQMLLWQNPHGILVDDLALKCSVCERTIYRDLAVLESELGVPIWEEGSKRGVIEGYFLPPVTFTPSEAMNVFLSTRLMQNRCFPFTSNITSTFMKLNTIMPPALKEQVQNIIFYLDKLPKDENRIRNFSRITQAWMSQNCLKIHYQEELIINSREYTIEPYFVEPAAWGRGIYVIAYSHEDKFIRPFKVQHIIGEVVITPERYKIPSDFDITQNLGLAWGMDNKEEIIKVKLQFNKKITQFMIHNIIDPSQKIFTNADGSIIMELKVCNTRDFRSWILNFGDDVTVLEPDTLIREIIAINKSILSRYNITDCTR
jgi:predicted DNA-binding transcriptional regulator YafY